MGLIGLKMHFLPICFVDNFETNDGKCERANTYGNLLEFHIAPRRVNTKPPFICYEEGFRPEFCAWIN